MVTYDDCATRAQKALLSDLEGLTAFDKTTRQMMCTLQQSDRSKAQSFVYETLTATDTEQFDATVSEYIKYDVNITSTEAYTWTQPAIEQNRHVNELSAYQPDEFLSGNKITNWDTDEKKVYTDGNRVASLSQGIFGHCTDQNYLKFMKNEENSSCVIRSVNQITEDVCNKVGIHHLGLIELNTGDGQVKQPEIGNVSKFEVENFTEVALTDDEKAEFLKSTFVDEGCDNFILEMHYKIFFSAVSDGTVIKTCADGARFKPDGSRCCSDFWCDEGAQKGCTLGDDGKTETWSYCPDYQCLSREEPFEKDGETRCRQFDFCGNNYREDYAGNPCPAFDQCLSGVGDAVPMLLDEATGAKNPDYPFCECNYSKDHAEATCPQFDQCINKGEQTDKFDENGEPLDTYPFCDCNKKFIKDQPCGGENGGEPFNQCDARGDGFSQTTESGDFNTDYPWCDCNYEFSDEAKTDFARCNDFDRCDPRGDGGFKTDEDGEWCPVYDFCAAEKATDEVGAACCANNWCEAFAPSNDCETTWDSIEIAGRTWA